MPNVARVKSDEARERLDAAWVDLTDAETEYRISRRLWEKAIDQYGGDSNG